MVESKSNFIKDGSRLSLHTVSLGMQKPAPAPPSPYPKKSSGVFCVVRLVPLLEELDATGAFLVRDLFDAVLSSYSGSRCSTLNDFFRTSLLLSSVSRSAVIAGCSPRISAIFSFLLICAYNSNWILSYFSVLSSELPGSRLSTMPCWCLQLCLSAC